MDRKSDRNRKSMESKGVGLPRKVQIFLEKTEAKTQKKETIMHKKTSIEVGH